MQTGTTSASFFSAPTSRFPSGRIPGWTAFAPHTSSSTDPDESFDVAIATWWETAYQLARFRTKHYAYLVQGFEDRFYSDALAIYRPFVRETYRGGFHYFAVSEALRRRLCERFGQSAALVPPAIDGDRFATATAAIPRSGRLRVLIEGPHDILFKRTGMAFEAVKDIDDIEVVYLSSDGGREPGWRMDHYFDSAPHHDVPGIFASCDVLLKLSREESVSLPVLEMLSTGGTAVVAAFEGHDEYLRDGLNSLVVPIDDAAAATRAVQRLVESPTLVARLKKGAGETVRRGPWFHATEELERQLTRIAESDVDDCGTPDKSETLSELTELQRLHEAHNALLIASGEQRAELDVTTERLREAEAALESLTNSPRWTLGRLATWPLRKLANRS